MESFSNWQEDFPDGGSTEAWKTFKYTWELKILLRLYGQIDITLIFNLRVGLAGRLYGTYSDRFETEDWQLTRSRYDLTAELVSHLQVIFVALKVLCIQ